MDINRPNNDFRFCSWLVVAFSVLIFFSSASLKADQLVLTEIDLNSYAEHLYKKGEYYRAISEYKRLQFFFPESKFTGDSILQIGRAYMAGGSHDEAIEYWQGNLESDFLDPGLKKKIEVLLGISLLDKDQLNPYSLREENINRGISYFKQKATALEDLTEEYRLIPKFEEKWSSRQEIEKKSPILAGTLSTIIPGAGSYYTERYLEGTYAFFLTGLFFLATKDALRDDRIELAAVTGLFTLGFYGGSIYTAVNGAHKINDKAKSDQLYNLRQQYGVWFIPETNTRKGRF